MLHAANTDLFNPLVPIAHNSECQILPFPLQIRPAKVNLELIGGFVFIFFTLLGTNGLRKQRDELGTAWNVLRTGFGEAGRKITKL